MHEPRMGFILHSDYCSITNKLLFFSFRGPLDLTRFSGGLPSPSSLLFPYLMNPAGTRNLHHHWAHKGMFKIIYQNLYFLSERQHYKFFHALRDPQMS